jgi:glutaredoxin
MLTKIQLFQTVTVIGMAIGTFTNDVVSAEAIPSVSTSTQRSIPTGQVANNHNTTPRRYGRNIAAGTKIETVSGAAENEFAEYLTANGVKFYGAYWCSHCKNQKSLFGAVAATKLPYIECAKDGENSQRQLCRDKKIQMFPTWVINGKYITGTHDLEEIAELTGYKGSTNFKYQKKYLK